MKKSLILLAVIAAASHVEAAASRQVSPGASVTLSVDAAGTKPFTYQWYKGGNPVVGATAASYNIPAVTPSDAGNYSATVANTAGSTTSDIAALSVLVPPPYISYLGASDAWASPTNPVSIYWGTGDTYTVTLTDPNGVTQVVPQGGNINVTSGCDGYVWTLTAANANGVAVTRTVNVHGAFSSAAPLPTRKDLEQQAATVAGVSFDSVRDVFGAPGGLTAAQVHSLRDALDVLGVNN